MSTSPYVGLRPFQRDESNIFFGRQQHTVDLLAAMTKQQFLTVVGQMGCGKTSLIQAGVIPQLLEGALVAPHAHWKIAELIPGTQPFAHLAAALNSELALGDNIRAPIDESTLRANPNSLNELLAKHPLPRNCKLLIVCDQFEDIFRYPNADIKPFIDFLLACGKTPEMEWEPANPIYVITTLRIDYLDDYGTFPALATTMNKGLYYVPNLTLEQLRFAIEKPATMFGGKIEHELVTQLLSDLAQLPDQLLLLQHTLLNLWTKSNDKFLSIFDYYVLGGLKRALSNHADQIYQALTTEQQQVAAVLFKCLTETSKKHSAISALPIKLSEVAAIANVNWQGVAAVVEAFRKVGQGVLAPAVPTPLSPEALISIAHDSLIQQWQRLHDWVEDEAKAAETYMRLTDYAVHYQNNSAALMRSPELDLFWHWYEETKPTPTWAKRYGGNFQTAIAFLRKSQQRDLHKKIALLVGGVSLIAFIGFTINALLSKTSDDTGVTALPSTHQSPSAAINPRQPNISPSKEPSANPSFPITVSDTPTPTQAPAEETPAIIASKTIGKKTLSALHKQFPNKIELIQEYQKLNLDDPVLWHKLGNDLKRFSEREPQPKKRQQYSDAAIEAYQQTIRLQDHDYKAWFSLGDIYRLRAAAINDDALKENYQEKAIVAYNKVANLYPNSEWAFYYIGALYQQQNKLDDAVEYYKKQLHISPNHKFAWRYLASVYQRQNKLKEAIEANAQDTKVNLTNTQNSNALTLATEKSDYTIGEQLNITFTVSQPLYVRIVAINPEGEIKTLFPNTYQRNSFCKPGTYQIPPAGANFSLNIAGPVGQNKIKAIASKKPIPANALAFTQDGQFDEQKMLKLPIRATADYTIY